MLCKVKVIVIFKDSGFIYNYDNFSLDEFEFENGDVLEDVNVEYVLKGTPRYDEEGNIENIVIFCHNFNGNSFSIDDFSQLTFEGGPFDYKDYFFISITALGFPGSVCPSSTELKYKFPSYNFRDNVNFKKQFLKEKFGIEKVLGIIGSGIGGHEVYTWACEYPDDMDFIIVLNSSYKTNGYRYVVARGIESIIDASDDFYSDVYNESLSRTMVSINKILYSNYFSRRMFQGMSNDEIDVLMDEYVDEGLFLDIYDFKYRNDAILNYNLENKLSNIKAKALILSPSDDLYFSPQYDALPAKELIPDCEIILFEFNVVNLSDFDYSEFIEILDLFLSQF